jgi:hypothetical protein
MRFSISKVALLAVFATFTLTAAHAQQDNPVQNNAGQASQAAPNTNASPTAPANTSAANANPSAPSNTPAKPGTPATTNADNNPFDPVLEPPPLPKGKPTLIGGLATRVDQVRNRISVQPFGGGPKVKLFVDERSRIYRDGTETTILAVHKGDRIYVDTMLDGSRIFAKNLRIVTQTGVAEMRGQVIGFDPSRGSVSVHDQLSVHPITFMVTGATKYTSLKGNASAADLRPGSLIDVQFSPDAKNRGVAEQIVVLARPGDNYIFSGTVTSLDMRVNALILENRSDDQTYEVHFSTAALPDIHTLKVGSEVTAQATFDGKEYRASTLKIESASSEPEQDEQ